MLRAVISTTFQFMMRVSMGYICRDLELHLPSRFKCHYPIPWENHTLCDKIELKTRQGDSQQAFNLSNSGSTLNDVSGSIPSSWITVCLQASHFLHVHTFNTFLNQESQVFGEMGRDDIELAMPLLNHARLIFMPFFGYVSSLA